MALNGLEFSSGGLQKKPMITRVTYQGKMFLTVSDYDLVADEGDFTFEGFISG